MVQKSLLLRPFVETAGDSEVAQVPPCEFRRPSVAAGRRPLADTPLRHKHLRSGTARSGPTTTVEGVQVSPPNRPETRFFAMVERFDEGVWLDLTLKAANRCASGLELPEQVGTRAQASASDRRALWLVAALLRSKLDLWHIYDLWRVGLEMLRGPHAHDPEAEAELRARLLEREFYEARTTPDESPTEPTDPQ